MPVKIIVRESAKDGQRHGFLGVNEGRAVWRPLCLHPVVDHELTDPVTSFPNCVGCLIGWGAAEAAVLDVKFGPAVFSEPGGNGAWA